MKPCIYSILQKQLTKRTARYTVNKTKSINSEDEGTLILVLLSEWRKQQDERNRDVGLKTYAVIKIGTQYICCKINQICISRSNLVQILYFTFSLSLIQISRTSGRRKPCSLVRRYSTNDSEKPTASEFGHKYLILYVSSKWNQLAARQHRYQTIWRIKPQVS